MTATQHTATTRKTSRGFIPQITVFGKTFEMGCVPKSTEEKAMKESQWELKQVRKLEKKHGSYVSSSWNLVE